MSYIEIEQACGLGFLWMSRPERHNAFDAEGIGEFLRALTELEGDPSCRVVILAGRGASFCAGADLGWMKSLADADAVQNVEDARRLAALLRKLAGLRKPTIARVHGPALGGGLGLAAACDICIATRKASFAMSEVRLGLIPSVIGPYVVRAIGARQASRYALTGERLSAAEAHRIGLVHEITDTLDVRTGEITAALMQGGPDALAAAKTLLRDVAHCPIDDRLAEYTARRIADVRAGDEAREGMSAFLEKRPPSWRG
jgi:methylglutaconyl-CoA hydratase